MGSLTTPKGGSTIQTTQTQTPPAYVQAAQGNLLNASNALLNPYLQPQNYTLAPFNADQTGSFDLLRSLAQGQFASSAPRIDNGAVGTAVNAGDAQAPAGMAVNAGPAQAPVGQGSVNAADLGSAAQFSAMFGSGGGQATGSLNPSDVRATAASINPNSISQYMNPYIQNVVDAAASNIRRQYGEQSADIGAQAAAQGAFGGSREAIQRGQLNRATMDSLANTTAQLYGQGWNSALGAESTNAGYRQAANMANPQLAISAAQTNSSLQNAQFNRQLQAIQALLGVGNQQQQYYNQAVQQPLTYLQMLGQLTPQNYGGTTVGTQPNTAQSPLQTLLGVGTSLAGLALRR